MCQLNDESLLLTRFIADPSSPNHVTIEMQQMYPDGKTEPIAFDTNGNSEQLFQSNKLPHVSVSLDNRFGLIGPVNGFGAIRFRLDLKERRATWTDFKRNSSLREIFMILPDNERVASPDGTIARTDSFTDTE